MQKATNIDLGDDCPSVLVISNECLSLTGSNGRTILNLLSCWPKNKINQFYINPDKIDPNLCNNYLNISDREIISFFKKKRNIKKKEYIENKSNRKKISKNAFTKLIRDFLWAHSNCYKNNILPWAKKLNIDYILFVAGDSPFLTKFARKLSQDLSTPLVIYNSEDYYFKKYDYFRSAFIYKLFYPFFHFALVNSLNRAYKKSKLCVFNSLDLKSCYSKIARESIVIYNSSSIIKPICLKQDDCAITYLGNLGVGRIESLVSFANVLKQVSDKYFLNVYGKILSDADEQKLRLCDNIRYCGFVSYEKALIVMESSKLLIHVENFDKFYLKDLKHSFSTKIADCLSLGVPFLYYGPKETTASKYLLRNKCAHVANSENDLKELLNNILSDSSFANKYIEKSLIVAAENHNLEKNSIYFRDCVKNVIKK